MPHIKATIDSALTQTYSDLDIVVVNDGSSDGTGEFLDSITDPRVRVIHNETNLGAEGNWNRTLQEVRGPFFKLLCHDDTLERNAVATEVAALEANDNAVMTASLRNIIDEHDRVVIKAHGLKGWRGVVSGAGAVRTAVRRGGNPFGEPTAVLMRSSVVAEVGNFDAAQPYCIDVDYWVRLLAHGDLYAISETLCTFRAGSTSWSHELARKQRVQSHAFLRRVAADPSRSISKTVLWQGLLVSALRARARRLIYKVLDFRAARVRL